MPTLTVALVDNDLGRIYHALMIINSARKLGFEVHVFVLNKAVPLLLKGSPRGFRRIRGLNLIEELYIRWLMRKFRVRGLVELLEDALASGVKFYVDEFNLRALGKSSSDLRSGVKVAGTITFLTIATESDLVLVL